VFAVRPVAQPRVDPVAPREPVAPAGAAQNGPPRHSRSFGPADPQAFAAAAQALLANEPRVLRRPAPRIERGQESASSVLVEFALLPGHDEALGQRLLDALQQLARTL
jgi:hypothetical protein